MTAAPQGLVSDGSYGNGLPHCYQIASNFRKQKTYTPTILKLLFVLQTNSRAGAHKYVLGTLLQRVRLQALDLRKALDLGTQS